LIISQKDITLRFIENTLQKFDLSKPLIAIGTPMISAGWNTFEMSETIAVIIRLPVISLPFFENIHEMFG
jgi:hypothetical protein